MKVIPDGDVVHEGMDKTTHYLARCGEVDAALDGVRDGTRGDVTCGSCISGLERMEESRERRRAARRSRHNDLHSPFTVR